jgi:hypothetical protein
MKTKELTIKKEINPIIEKAQKIEIESKEDMTEATTALSQLNKFYDNLTEEKEKLTKPINSALKEIRARYKPVEEMLDGAISVIKSKMGKYQMDALQAQKEAEAKIASRVSRGTLGIEKAIEKIGDIDAPEEKIKTEEGGVSFRLVKKFRIMDKTFIPYEYLEPNEVKIRQAMVAGIEIKGVEYYEEQSVINRR